MTETPIKIQAGGFRYQATIWERGADLCIKFPFSRDLITEIKSMQGARWDPNEKFWYFKNSARNQFQLAYLQGKNPYAPYDAPLDLTGIPTERFHVTKGKVPLFKHQIEGTAHILQRPGSIIAGEMGTAKSLMAIIALETLRQRFLASYSEEPDLWYFAPRSGLLAVQRELRIWDARIQPKVMDTYEGLVKRMRAWKAGDKAPLAVIFDEASKIKNESAQRSQAARGLADGVRDDWGDQGRICLMSGSPAPKSPADWWFLAEVACPGFLREGDINKFKRRLGLIIMKESVDRGVYPQLITWRDDESKCNECGLLREHDIHRPELCLTDKAHDFKPSVNEVKKLYGRLRGLTVVYFKKDCLDLPEKHYRLIECKPKASVLRAAQMIIKAASTTIQGLTLLRELSDGFQYKETASGTATCSLCKGEKEIEQPFEIPDTCPNCTEGTVRESRFQTGMQVCGNHSPKVELRQQKCPHCGGMGEVTTFTRTVVEIECPKDQVLTDILDEHEDIGRLVVFAGFTGSIDRCVNICRRQGWHVIRMDEGKIRVYEPNGQLIQHSDFQSMFQDHQLQFGKVAFVAHPKSGGMGLTLTASPTTVYYSNDFDFESRVQSEDRIHRPGMDYNRGATIIDIVHLSTDQKILDNLKKKRDLQALSLGDFKIEEGERTT